jgi:hypothetical protein
LRIFSTAASVATLVIAGHGVAAAQVSANGARDVQTTLESYFGKGSDGTSAVRVTPNGTNDGYDVSIDIARLAKPLEAAGVTVKPALFGFGLKPAAGGTWAYTQTSFPTLSMTVPNGSFEFSTNAFAGTGTFDPKLGAFTAYASTAKTVSSRTTDSTSKVTADTQDVKLTGSSKDAGGGLIDGTFAYVTGNFAETVTGAAGGPPIRISVADANATGNVSGQAAKATLDLWSFLVGHPSKDALANDQAALKAKILAALPVFKRVAVNAGVNNLIVETPMGNARVSKLGLTEAATGVVPEGQFEFGLSVGTIEPPSGIAPAWAVSLIPKESNLGVKVTGFNPDRLVRLMVDKLDLKAPKPLDLKDDEVLAAILPGGKLLVDLTASKLVSDLYNVTWSGQIEVNPMSSFVSGKATVTAKGLDKIRETLAKQTDTVQYATGLALVKGMAKQVDGNDVWELEFDSNGTFIVNGQKMGG